MSGLPLCMEVLDGKCRGTVEYRAVPNGRGMPRCEYHFARRMDAYENSMERYAHSDSPPAWFDPSYAGERWDDDD